MRYFVTIDGIEQIVDVERLPDGSCRASLPGAPSRSVELVRSAGGTLVMVGERVVDLVIDGESGELGVYAGGRRHTVRVETHAMRAVRETRRHSAARAGSVVVSPMPGKVVQVLVQPGQAVTEGTPLIVVEAMKMENQLSASAEGVVSQILVKAGDNVDGGARLMVIE